ncbi:hypothetical protein ACFF2X_44065, partial [Cryptosporangium minutisporangium]
LIFEVDYEDDSIGGCRVVDGDTTVYDPTHDFDGAIELENGLIRLQIEEHTDTLDISGESYTVESGSVEYYDRLRGDGRLQVDGVLRLSGERGKLLAYGWDDGWSEVSLPATRWGVYDVDLTEVGMARTVARVTFVSDSDLYVLDAISQAGYSDVLWSVPNPDVQGPVPDGL